MKGTTIRLGQIGDRDAAVLVVDGRLDDLLIQPPDDAPPLPGAIARAVVYRPVKGMGGLFLRLPNGRAFLRGAKGLRQGQSILVQVTGLSEPGKAPPVTQKLLFKSRFAIVTPDAPGRNISRSIRDEEERVRLAELAAQGMDGSGFGLILRSASEQADDIAIAEDITAMRSIAEAVAADAEGGPEWLLDAPDVATLAQREWPAPDEVIEAPGALVADDLPEQIGTLFRAREDLPGTGHLYVEPTRALVAVDVNTGADTSPAAALKANLAAAKALPRALRLRGLGGQIVVDFAPLPKKDRRQIESTLRAAFKRDPIETALVGWTPLGHFELQRKRERLPLDPALAGALG